MINFIPIFPLKVVVYPGEALNLHIFEPRYKQLIRECLTDSKPFGIPVVLDDKVEEWGTAVEVTELVKEYDNGEMDIRTRGTRVFRVLEVVKEIPDKLYSGAIVDYPANNTARGDSSTAQLIVREVRRLYALFNAEAKAPKDLDERTAYEIAHFVGLSPQQEYEMLGLLDELQRLEFLRRHLASIIPVVQNLEAMKARIQQNGHFKELSLGDLNL